MPSSTELTTSSSTEPTTNSSCEPTTNSSIEPTTNSSSEPTTDSMNTTIAKAAGQARRRNQANAAMSAHASKPGHVLSCQAKP